MQRAAIVVSENRTILQLSEPIKVKCPKCNTPFAIEEVELPDVSTEVSNVDKIKGIARHRCENCGIEMTVEMKITDMASVPAANTPPAN